MIEESSKLIDGWRLYEGYVSSGSFFTRDEALIALISPSNRIDREGFSFAMLARRESRRLERATLWRIMTVIIIIRPTSMQAMVLRPRDNDSGPCSSTL